MASAYAPTDSPPPPPPASAPPARVTDTSSRAVAAGPSIARTAAALRDVCLTSRGPAGRFKVVRSARHGSAIGITTTSSKLLRRGGLEKVSPAARLMVDAARSQLDAHADAGLLTLGLAADLVARCQSELVDTGACARHSVVQGLANAAEWAESYLLSPTCPVAARVRWSSLDTVSAVVRSVVGAKGVARLDDDSLGCVCNVLLQAFLACVPEDPVSLIRFVRLPGVRTLQSSVVTRGVLLDLPVAEDGLFALGGDSGTGAVPPLLEVKEGAGPPAAVALFDVSLRVRDTEGDDTSIRATLGAGDRGGDARTTATAGVSGDAASDGTAAAAHGAWGTGALERAQLERLGRHLLEMGVRLVGCQRLIHPWLKRYLLRRGVLALERLSIRHIGAVAAVTGARVFSAWDATLDAESMGHAASVRPRVLGSRTYVEVVGADEDAADGTGGGAGAGAASSTGYTTRASAQRRRPLSTVVLCGPDESAVDELEAAAQAAVRCLGSLLTEPYVVAGGGCAEVHAAAHVRARAAAAVDAARKAARSSRPTGTAAPAGVAADSSGGAARLGALGHAAQADLLAAASLQAARAVAAERRREAATLQLVANAFASALEGVAGGLAQGSALPQAAATRTLVSRLRGRNAASMVATCGGAVEGDFEDDMADCGGGGDSGSGSGSSSGNGGGGGGGGGGTLYGWDPIAGRDQPVLSFAPRAAAVRDGAYDWSSPVESRTVTAASVLDARACTVSALRAAADVACALLRVQVIVRDCA